MTTTTDNDLRDLLTQTDLTAAQIDECMANPDAVLYAKSVLDVVHRMICERLTERIIEKLFPDGFSSVVR